MKKIDIKDNVSSSKLVTFSFYRDGNLWYKTADGTEFPVPIDDIGNATFGVTEKAILLMRYMRKWNAKIAEAVDAEA